eukprot:Platyproteum_vivax@DN6644_c0_g1_i1.p2
MSTVVGTLTEVYRTENRSKYRPCQSGKYTAYGILTMMFAVDTRCQFVLLLLPVPLFAYLLGLFTLEPVFEGHRLYVIPLAATAITTFWYGKYQFLPWVVKV